MSRLRSSYDREILRLAVLALGSLAAEPLYVLADTAIVGHLGRSQLAALGISAIVLSGAFALFNFLTYGTTAQVARATGAEEHDTARGLGVQALWLSLGVGVGLAVVLAALAEPVVAAMGGDGKTADYAVLYMRIAVIGLPFAFLARGGEGYLRGLSNLRTPLVIFISANVLNLVLEVLFVYGFDWGIAGSAWGTVVRAGCDGARVRGRDVRPGCAGTSASTGGSCTGCSRSGDTSSSARRRSTPRSSWREPWRRASATRRSPRTRSRRSSGSSSRSSSTRSPSPAR